MEMGKLGLIVGLAILFYVIVLVIAGCFVYFCCMRRRGHFSVINPKTKTPSSDAMVVEYVKHPSAPRHDVASGHNSVYLNNNKTFYLGSSDTLNVSTIDTYGTDEELGYSSMSRIQSNTGFTGDSLERHGASRSKSEDHEHMTHNDDAQEMSVYAELSRKARWGQGDRELYSSPVPPEVPSKDRLI